MYTAHNLMLIQVHVHTVHGGHNRSANRDDYVVAMGLFCWSVGSMKLVVAS